MEKDNLEYGGEHGLRLENRERLEISGVTSVVSYTSEELQIRTELGGLIISGSGLEVLALDLEEGQLDVKGEVNQIRYAEPDMAARGRGLLRSLLK